MGNNLSRTILFAALTLSSAASASTTSDNRPLDEIIVTATLREGLLEETPGSVSVLTGTTLHDAGQQHFEDVLPLVPLHRPSGGMSERR